MQNEYDYILAEQMTKNLLSQGLITEEEFEKIMDQKPRILLAIIIEDNAKMTCYFRRSE